MKIIGQTPSGFIAIIANDELANLLGHYSTYSSDCPRFGILLEDLHKGNGVDVDIGGMYKLARDMRSVKTDLASASKTLRACADLIDRELEPVTSREPAP